MRRSNRTNGEIVFDCVNNVLMLFICFITLYPIWYILVNSFNEGADAMLGGIFWWPRKFTIENYTAVFANTGLMKSFGVTIARTLVGTVTNVLFTAMVAYPLSKSNLIGRKFYIAMGTVTMFFSGGLIPAFLLYKNLGLLDSFWIYIWPSLFNFFNLIIFVNFFKEIPSALEESSSIDGANDLVIFFRIILPLSKPVLATIALFTGVYHWNDYFSGVIYINDADLQPVQTFLYRIVAESGSNQMVASATNVVKTTTSLAIKLSTMVITTFPIICVYPFLQKYFVKGMLIGAVKE
ncbi:carbohydrate ABC transporter permease [Candidatus Epulonipiscium viviparus]|uniref:carbohydrate ABC transporter permease n=1 Tax=Candidatus Epulonipiscium viviparus TaxID=420336 RepID=UPI00016C0B28|nr:carbohydrate ABC transporter permease [Candidatus Epulopiscium viviparus]